MFYADSPVAGYAIAQTDGQLEMLGKVEGVAPEVTFHYCGQDPHNYAAFLGVPQTEWEHWANADSAIVCSDWRGNGLQRKMLEAALPLFPETITHLGATVNPENRYSLNNALAAGFVVKARREMYGGYDRYLLEKEL